MYRCVCLCKSAHVCVYACVSLSFKHWFIHFNSFLLVFERQQIADQGSEVLADRVGIEAILPGQEVFDVVFDCDAEVEGPGSLCCRALSLMPVPPPLLSPTSTAALLLLPTTDWPGLPTGLVAQTIRSPGSVSKLRSVWPSAIRPISASTAVLRLLLKAPVLRTTATAAAGTCLLLQLMRILLSVTAAL